MYFSLEISPQADVKTLPEVKDVYITMLPGGDYKDTARKAIELVEAGYNPVPHFPARSISDEKDLEDYILEVGKIDKKFKKGSAEYKKLLQEQREKLSIQRFKGLGEMNSEELWETTLNPDNRTMLRVQYSKGTKEKSKEDQKMIKVLMGDEVAP